jgi:hypothetical protein
MVEEPLLCFCLIIYRELKKLNSPKINEPIKKWATELNRTFFKGRSPNGKKNT